MRRHHGNSGVLDQTGRVRVNSRNLHDLKPRPPLSTRVYLQNRVIEKIPEMGYVMFTVSFLTSTPLAPRVVTCQLHLELSQLPRFSESLPCTLQFFEEAFTQVR